MLNKKEEVLFSDMDLPPDPLDNLESGDKIRSKNEDNGGTLARVVKQVYSFFCDVGDRIVPEAEISLAIPEPEEEIDQAVSYLLREGAICSVKPGFFRMVSDSDSGNEGKTKVKNLKHKRRTTKMNKDKNKDENKDERSDTSPKMNANMDDFFESDGGIDKEQIPVHKEAQKLKRDLNGIYDLTENDVGADISGERVDIKDVIGKNIVIKDMSTRPSTFHNGDYAVIQLAGDRVLMTSSSILIEQIRDIKDKLPIRCQISEHESAKKHMTYYSLSKSLL